MIDPVVNTLSTTSTTQSSGSTDKASEIANTFYKLLTTQIQYQDPLNPIENTEFTSQLAQLTSVEQLQGVNKNLTYLQLYMASINNSQALGFIGKEIKATGNTVYWNGETSPSLDYTLNGDASRVIINIFDQNNRLVRTIHAGQQSKGDQSIVWDGKDKNGNAVSKGLYKFEVLATNTDGKAVSATTMLSGTVEGLTFENGVTYVEVNGQKIAIGDIISISAPKQSDNTTSDQTNSNSSIGTVMKTLGKAAMMAVPLML
ncbi:MAG: flagellar hook assembly protein FlgD [Desulfobacterota bacterium]|nr:flagellar hook assembly protein FlgD [Thermodesulfobacteriota bacterium]